MIDEWFNGEKLETINLLSQYEREEIQQMLIIMIYWEDMIKEGIINDNDINELSTLSEEKQNKIKEYVSNKINQQIERNNNGTKES